MTTRQQKPTIFTAALCLILALSGALTSAQTPELRPLTTRQVIERELKGDEAHSYSLALTAGQYLDLVVEQKGVDVVVSLFNADGKKVIEVDSPNGTQGAEPIAVIIETAGNYRLEVRSLEKTAAAGRYEVKIKELRTATEKDKIRIAANKAFDEAELLRQQGMAESLQNAIKKYEESLPLFHAIEDYKQEALTLNQIGFVYRYLGERQQALKYFNKALPLYRQIGDKVGEVAALANLGTIYNDLGETQQALKFFNDALPLYVDLDDKSGRANTLAGIGTVYSILGEKQQALKFYNESLLLSRAIGDKGSQAAALNNIGLLYRDLGEKQQALKYFNESLPLFREVSGKSDEALILGNIGLVYSDLGEKQQALKFYNDSLALSRVVGDKGGAARTLNNIGLVYSDLGERQQALKFYNESLSISRQGGDKHGQAFTLNNIARVFHDLGEQQQALKFYNECLLLFREVGDKGGQASTLTSIGAVHRNLGEKQQALKFYSESLPLLREVGDKNGQAVTLNNIGVIYDDLGDRQQALKFYNESLPLRNAIGDKSGEAQTRNNIGKSYNDLGEKQQALKFYSESLSLYRVAGDKAGEANTLGNLFYTFLTSDNPRFGVFYGKQSVNNYQILRSNVQGLDKNLQQTFLKSIEIIYRALADTLIKQQRYAEAQQVLNSFKDQQFFDFTQTKQFAPLAVTVREAELTATFNQKLETLVAAMRAIDEHKRAIGERQLTAAETAQLQSLEAKQTAVNADYLAFLKSAEKEFAAPPSDKDKFPAVPDLTQLQATLRELTAQTGEKSVAVYTLVGDENYRALVVTPDNISAVSTPMKGGALNQKAQQLWRLLRTPQYDPQPLAKEIYDVVFAPLAAKLPADTKTILWSLDGKLRYLPMAALHDGKGYLVERYNNVVFTRADKERLTRNVSANLTGTGLGGSEAHTVKLGSESFNAAALPFVKTELARIFKNNNSTTGVLSGEVLLDARFTRSAMLSTLQKRRPLVHIASHFKFEPGDEANSFLLLGDGSPFTLDEMKRQKDLFAGVELLALSACETAAQREGNGREVDGFAELAQRLGAGAVMASLWEVSDDSTAELMARFYKTYNSRNGANKATSLRSAQIALLRGEYKTAGVANRQLTREDAKISDKIKIDKSKLKPYKAAKTAPFAHPFYWSPFILIGNWK